MKIHCPCDYSFDIKHNAAVNLDEEPDLITKIQDGSFLNFLCPRCGKNIKAELKTRIVWKSKKQVLLYVPENERIACLSYCAGLKQVDLETDKEIRKDFLKPDETPVIGYAELSERVAILAGNLDPQTIEAVKFFIIDSAKQVEGKNIQIFFDSRLDDDTMEFHVFGFKDDEVAVIKIPSSLYKKINDDIKAKKESEVFSALYLGQYLSYKNIFTEGQKDE